MAYAAPLGERTSELRGSPLRRLVGGLLTVLGMGVCIGTLLVLLADAVTEDTPRRTTAGAEPATISLPYGGQLERPDPGDLIEPGGLMGLGLLASGARQRTGLRVRGRARRHAGPLGRRDPPSPAQPPRARRRPGRAARGRPHRGRARRGARGLGRPARRGRGREPPGPPERPRPRGPGHDLRPDPRAPPTRARAPARAPTRAERPEARMARRCRRPHRSPRPEPAPAEELVEDLVEALIQDPAEEPAASRPGARRRRRPRTPGPAPPLPRPAGRRRRASVARHPARHGSLGLASRTPGPGAVAQPAAGPALVGAH